MSLDWDKYEVKTNGNNAQSDGQPIDWDKYEIRKNDDAGFMKRIPLAAGNVASDIWKVAKATPKAVVETIGNIPSDIDYLKKNVPLAGKLIANDPMSALKEAIGGTAELGGDISRIPPGVVSYLARIGLIKPETARQFAPVFSENEVRNMVDKFIGNEQPGGKLVRGTFHDAPQLLGAAKALQLMNPLKYTKSSIAKKILEEEEKQVGIHRKAYEDLWNDASKSKIDMVPFNPEKIRIDSIRNFPNEDFYSTTEKFLENPTLENAHVAQSDLGKLSRFMKKNPTIASPSVVRDVKKAAEEARDHIRSQMFRDASGKINERLAKRYDVISKSYGRNVIPYTTNRALQSYKAEDITLPELINGLKTGRFARRAGWRHPELNRPEQLEKTLKALGYTGGALAGGEWLINKLTGKNQETI